MASAKTWAKFSDAWRDILWMSPRIEYFKYAEAMNFKGQFAGISEASRNEKVRLFLNLIEEHKIVGIASAIPHHIFFPLFGSHPHKFVRNPYFISFYGIAGHLIAHLAANGIKEKIEFIFDFQPGSDQMREAQDGWANFREVAPAEYHDCIQVHPPSFLDDKDVVALQAADLHAGWTRETLMMLQRGATPKPIWYPSGEKIISIGVSWGLESLTAMFHSMFGYNPAVTTYTFQHGLNSDGPSYALL